MLRVYETKGRDFTSWSICLFHTFLGKVKLTEIYIHDKKVIKMETITMPKMERHDPWKDFIFFYSTDWFFKFLTLFECCSARLQSDKQFASALCTLVAPLTAGTEPWLDNELFSCNGSWVKMPAIQLERKVMVTLTIHDCSWLVPSHLLSI